MEPQNKKNIDVSQALQKIQPILQKYKLVWITSLSVLVIIGLIYLVGSLWVSSPEDVVADFKKAVNAKDAKAFQELIHVPDDEPLTMDETAVENLLAHFHKNNNYLNSINDSLDMQVNRWEYTDSGTYEVPGFGADFQVQKVEIPFFFDTHAIVVQPYYINLKTAEEQVTLHVNGEKVFTSTKENTEYQFGPVLPSVYKITAQKKYPYTEVKNESEITALNKKDSTINRTINLPTTTVNVSSEFDDTKILVNGKDSTKTTADGKDFGPVATDGSTVLVGQKTFPWGVEKSAPVKASNSWSKLDLTPSGFQSEKQQQEIQNLINKFIQELHQAKLKQDANLLTNIHDSLKNDYAEEVARMNSMNRAYKGDIYATRIGFGHVTLKPDPDSDSIFYAEIPIEVHKKTGISNKHTDSNPLKEEFTKEIIELQYNAKAKQWVVSDYRNDFTYKFEEKYLKGDKVVKTEF